MGVPGSPVVGERPILSQVEEPHSQDAQPSFGSWTWPRRAGVRAIDQAGLNRATTGSQARVAAATASAYPSVGARKAGGSVDE